MGAGSGRRGSGRGGPLLGHGDHRLGVPDQAAGRVRVLHADATALAADAPAVVFELDLGQRGLGHQQQVGDGGLELVNAVFGGEPLSAGIV